MQSYLVLSADALQAGRVRALEAVQAYQWKALEAQRKTNAVTEFIEEAEDYARSLDDDFEEWQKSAPLFGVPFSVKESIAVRSC